MISADYCVMMARYNRWQNNQLRGFLDALDPPELTLDRKGFFGSILATINHLYWGDSIWMSRLDGGAAPQGGIPDSTDTFATLGQWSVARKELDDRILAWANSLSDADLAGDLTWYSGATKSEKTVPLHQVITHVFNHQTHHRGQVHAMLTAAGSNAPVTDLVFMPDDA